MAPSGLLDSYESERRPVAADVLNSTRAHSEITSDNPWSRGVMTLLKELVRFDEVNRFLIEKVTGIGIHYDFGSADERVGRRQRDIPAGGRRLTNSCATAVDCYSKGRARLPPRAGIPGSTAF